MSKEKSPPYINCERAIVAASVRATYTPEWLSEMARLHLEAAQIYDAELRRNHTEKAQEWAE